MSHEHNEAYDGLTFYCDSPGCEANRGFPAADFVACSQALTREGWRSYKRVGRDWTDHCPNCAAQAERDHADHKRLELERERIRSKHSG